jgi:hypothetical protein
MKRYFQRFRDDRFALTTLQNPNIEVRTHAQLVQAAQPFVAQPLLAVQGAAQIAATQPLAAPDAPDSIPAVQLPVVEPLTAPAPDPTAPAPLDSASPVFASPDSVNNDAQQFLDSLVAGVLTAGSSLPSSPSLSSDDDELTAPPTTKPRRKAKSKSRRKSNRGTRNLACPERTRRACASSAASTEDQDPDPDDSPEPTPPRAPRPQMFHLQPSPPRIYRRSLPAMAQPRYHQALLEPPVPNQHLPPRPRLQSFRSAQPQSAALPRQHHRGHRQPPVHHQGHPPRHPRPSPRQRRRPLDPSHPQIRSHLFHAAPACRGRPARSPKRPARRGGRAKVNRYPNIKYRRNPLKTNNSTPC